MILSSALKTHTEELHVVAGGCLACDRFSVFVGKLILRVLVFGVLGIILLLFLSCRFMLKFCVSWWFVVLDRNYERLHLRTSLLSTVQMSPESDVQASCCIKLDFNFQYIILVTPRLVFSVYSLR